MMGDVVLRGKLPYPMFMEFSWLMELQWAWGFIVLTMRNSSCLLHCGFQIGSSLEQDRNVMPVQPWTSWQGNMEENSNPKIWRSCQETATEVVGDWIGSSLEGMLTQSDQSGMTWLWCHSWLTATGTWIVLRQHVPGLLLWQPSQWSRKNLEDGVPVCVEDFSIKWVLGKWGR
jgi:hypothetical protein